MLALALVLDAVIGEPAPLWKRVPHPIVLMGRLVDVLDDGLNRGGFRHLKGLVAVVVLVLVTGAPALLLSIDLFGGVFEVLFAAILLAHRSLVDHVGRVAEAMGESREAAIEAVSHIVGRDTAMLEEPGIARAAIESGAENFSDGVVAPAFWFLIFGLPGIVVYKAVNTADSMIGHRTERYGRFGWAAARLDDGLNYLPARLTAVLFAVVAGKGLQPLQVAMRDGWLHRSVNAGWPEAAMAASLNLALAGPRHYAGALTDDPFMNPTGRKDPGAKDIRAAVALLWKAWGLLVGVAAVLWLLAFGWGYALG
ncbi:MAG: adenosylcobinamide-phosphate synthase CbiB [Pseudomonadota bacterium]